MISASIFIAAPTAACKEIYESAGPWRFQPEFIERDTINGYPVTEVECPDPNYGYWAQHLAEFLCEKLPRISQCMDCEAQFVEQPGEDAEACPSCGYEF